MLSSNAKFDEQGQAAIIRDLERLNMLVTGGVLDPASAQDQNISQGNQSVQLPGGSTMGGATIATLPLPAFPPIPASNAPWSNSEVHQSTYGSGNLTGTFTVPASISRVLIYIVGAGSNWSQTRFYAASSSGGTTTTGLSEQGGSGALIIAELPVTPGQTIAWVAGGASSGNSGNASSMSTSGVTLTAGGGTFGFGGLVTRSGSYPNAWNVVGICGVAGGLVAVTGGFFLPQMTTGLSAGSGGDGSTGSQGAVAFVY